MTNSSAGSPWKAQSPSSITTTLSAPSGNPSRSRRPVVTSTAPPSVPSVIRWLAASTCRLVTPGTTRSAIGPPAISRRCPTILSVLS